MKLSLRATSLARTLAATHAAVSTDETRPHLNSLRIEATEGDALIAVATDGHRLHAVRVACDVDAIGEVLIPSDSVSMMRQTLARALKGQAKETRIKDGKAVSVVNHTPMVATLARKEGDSFLTFTVGETSIQIRPTDATFPPWEQVIAVPAGARLAYANVAPHYMRDAFACAELFATDDLQSASAICTAPSARKGDDEGSLDPVRVEATRSNGDFFYALMMPMRVDRGITPAQDPAARLRPAVAQKKASAQRTAPTEAPATLPLSPVASSSRARAPSNVARMTGAKVAPEGASDRDVCGYCKSTWQPDCDGDCNVCGMNTGAVAPVMLGGRK